MLGGIGGRRRRGRQRMRWLDGITGPLHTNCVLHASCHVWAACIRKTGPDAKLVIYQLFDLGPQLLQDHFHKCESGIDHVYPIGYMNVVI